MGASINSFADRMQAQLAAAMPNHSGNGADEVNTLIKELEAAQHEADRAGQHLDGMVQTLEAGHSEIVLSLSDILGHLQFQDVMKQRLGQVFDALRDLSDLLSLSSSGAPRTKSLIDLLEDQRTSYVMESQRLVHASVDTTEHPAHHEAVRIELF